MASGAQGPAPADEPLRLGVVGLGRAFKLMLPTFLRDPRVRLVAACDARPSARAQFARDFQAPVIVSCERAALRPLHDGAWGRATQEVCLALLTSAREQRDVDLNHAVLGP